MRKNKLNNNPKSEESKTAIKDGIRFVLASSPAAATKEALHGATSKAAAR